MPDGLQLVWRWTFSMAIPDNEIAAGLRALFRMDCGFWVCILGMLEIGQHENLNFWVESKDSDDATLWYKEDLQLEEAIDHFLRIRRERGLGFDFEIELNSDKS